MPPAVATIMPIRAKVKSVQVFTEEFATFINSWVQIRFDFHQQVAEAVVARNIKV